MKANGFYVDLENKKQSDWWMKTGSKLVRVKHSHAVHSVETDKLRGWLIVPAGLLSRYVIYKINKFMPTNGKMVKVTFKD